MCVCVCVREREKRYKFSNVPRSRSDKLAQHTVATALVLQKRTKVEYCLCSQARNVLTSKQDCLYGHVRRINNLFAMFTMGK